MSRVGKDVLSYCTSCRMDLNHTIVAMQGDRIIRVHCRTCKKEHQYKSPTGATAPTKRKIAGASGSKLSTPARTRESIEEAWERKMNESHGKSKKVYNFRSTYVAGDLIDHPTYGSGVVEKVIHPDKIEVFFRRDIKVLKVASV